MLEYPLDRFQFSSWKLFPQSRRHFRTSHAALSAIPRYRSFLYREVISLLTFHVAFTQPNCPAKNSSLLTFNLRNLLPFCWSYGVVSVTVLSAVLKWNRNVCCFGASRMLHRKALQFTRYNFVAYWGKLTNIWNRSALSRDHGGKKIAPVDWLGLFMKGVYFSD